MNWQVTVYRYGAIIAQWEIENRTEQEAEQEAMEDIQKEFPLSDDWTMEITT